MGLDAPSLLPLAVFPTYVLAVAAVPEPEDLSKYPYQLLEFEALSVSGASTIEIEAVRLVAAGSVTSESVAGT